MMCVVVCESVLLQMWLVQCLMVEFSLCMVYFANVSCTYSDVLYMSLHIPGSMCVGVTLWYGWGGVVSICRLKHYWSVHVECGG